MKAMRLAIFGLLLQSAGALAADADGKFAMKGAGFLPCGVYVQERASQSNVYYMIGGWLEGYLSAYNRFAADTFDVASFQSLELMLNLIDQHCQDNPDDRLFGVIDALLADFAESRIKTESIRVRIEEGPRQTQLYRETISRIQSKLAEKGLYHDEIDGRYAEAVKSAIMAYQSDIGFEMTGFPDQATLWRLLRE
ncbi:MAG: hypothetical protein Tsb0010_13760 [Parvularculaceae bacterium]